MTRPSEFLRALDARLLLGDGGLGTRLAGAVETADRPVPELNLSSPEAVLRVHHEDVAAGADIIVTNTLTASRARFGERTAEVNREGVRLARLAAGAGRFVAGSIGPGSGPDDVRERCEILSESGCDLLILETFTEGEELLEACRTAVAARCPVSAQMARGDAGVLAKASEIGAAVVGVNCMGPDEAIRALEGVRPGSARLAAWPSAGLPVRVGGRTVYPVRPDAFAVAAARLADLGVRILGGCCGTGSAHLKAAAGRLKGKGGS